MSKALFYIDFYWSGVDLQCCISGVQRSELVFKAPSTCSVLFLASLRPQYAIDDLHFTVIYFFILASGLSCLFFPKLASWKDSVFWKIALMATRPRIFALSLGSMSRIVCVTHVGSSVCHHFIRICSEGWLVVSLFHDPPKSRRPLK